MIRLTIVWSAFITHFAFVKRADTYFLFVERVVVCNPFENLGTSWLLKNVVGGSPATNKIAAVSLKSDLQRLQRFTQNEFHTTGSTNNECHMLFGSRCLGAVHPFNCVQGRL